MSLPLRPQCGAAVPVGGRLSGRRISQPQRRRRRSTRTSNALRVGQTLGPGPSGEGVPRDGTPPNLDTDGLLHHRDHWVSLSPVEQSLAAALLDRFGAVVAPRHARRAGLAEGLPTRNALDVHVLRLRRRIAPLGLEIRTVRARGYLLQTATQRERPLALSARTGNNPLRCSSGIDTGGTFTDVVDGDGRVAKVLSTPDDPARAVAEAIAQLAGARRPGGARPRHDGRDQRAASSAAARASR